MMHSVDIIPVLLVGAIFFGLCGKLVAGYIKARIV
jgi:hypothetical protein